MSSRLLEVADDFWNLRGDFKIGGLLNIGTHCSLVRRAGGKFVLLDAYTLNGEMKSKVGALTNDGADIEAIINLHPFHTVHVRAAHQQFPRARLYGTRRHVDKFSELPWEAEHTESAECAALFADDLDFSVPEGVDFISKNEQLHFSSVLAFHKTSKTIHADDTLMYMRLPGPLDKLRGTKVTFHPSLALTLERRAGAAAEFRTWASGLAKRWHDAENLCAAHSAALLGRRNTGEPVAVRIRTALRKVEWTLRAHARIFG